MVNVAKKEHKRAIKVESFYLNKSKEPFGAVYGCEKAYFFENHWDLGSAILDYP